MGMTDTELVRKLTNIASNYQTVYLWGGWGQQINETNLAAKSRQYPKWYTRDKMTTIYNPLLTKGYWGFDCVNLVKSVLWGWTGENTSNGGASINTRLCPDYSANQMIDYCKNVTTNFSNVSVGEALWCEGHFGVYIGNGLAVEATPSWGYTPGVKISAVKNMGIDNSHPRQRTWTKHGFMPFIEYTGVPYDISNMDVSSNYESSLSGENIKGTYNFIHESSLSGENIKGTYNFIYEDYETSSNLSTQPFHTFVELWIGDVHIPPIKPEKLVSFEVTLLTENSVDEGDSAVTATLTLFDKYCDELEYLFITKGNDVRVKFGHITGRQSTILSLIATRYNVNITPAGNILTVELTSKGSMDGNQLVTGQLGDSPSEAIKTICKKVGWKVGRIDDSIQMAGHGGEMIKFNLLNEKPLNYIRNVIAPRAVRSSDGKGGYQFYLDTKTTPNTAYFRPIDLSDGGVKTYVYQKGKNSPVIDFNLSQSLAIAESAVTEYVSSGIDPLTKDKFDMVSSYSNVKIDVTNPNINFKDSDNSKVMITDNVSKSEVESTVAYRFTNDVTINGALGTITILGDPSSSIADIIRIIILNRDNTMYNLSGLYFVNGVNHNISNGTLITTLSVFKQDHIDGTVKLKSAKIVK